MVWPLLWRRRYLRLPRRMVPKCSSASVSGQDCEPLQIYTLWGHVIMPAPRDTGKELGKAPLTSKAMKRRNKWEHSEKKRSRWDRNSGACTLISACWSLTIWVTAACLFSVFGMHFFHVTCSDLLSSLPRHPGACPYFIDDCCQRLLSPIISWPLYTPKGKGQRKSPVAFEIYLH